jgi:hypothetical protein
VETGCEKGIEDLGQAVKGDASIIFTALYKRKKKRQGKISLPLGQNNNFQFETGSEKMSPDVIGRRK